MTNTGKKKGKSPLRLNRYTSIPVALDMLINNKLTLLSPESWEDQNDAYYIKRYCVKQNLKSVLALCFSTKKETFHHWRIFANGASGVCIEFDKKKLLQAFARPDGFQDNEVTYLWVKDLEQNKPPVDKWPFLKRKPFEDESEYRIIYASPDEDVRVKQVDIALNCIRKITLSPWLAEPVTKSVINIIKSIPFCSNLRVNRSSLIDNAGWRRAVD